MKKSLLKIAETAQTLMNSNIPCVYLGQTIKDVKEMLLGQANKFETIDYIYVIDSKRILYGVISIKEVFRAREDARVEALMKKKIISVNPSTDQEKIVSLALSSGLKSIPVVSKENYLFGIVPYDTILRIFNQEAAEDVFKSGGVFPKISGEFITEKSSASMIIKSRLPWLIIGVLGGIIFALIISGFEDTLNKLLVLVAFIPVLVYITGAASVQSQTLIIRNLALNRKFFIGPYLLKELKVVSVLGLICGVFFSFIALMVWKDILAGIIVGFSMFLSIVFTAFISVTLPLFFRKINLDPAAATGPLATLISDVITLIIYLSIAALFLSLFLRS